MKNGEIKMYVVSSFEHSTYLELAITELQQKGISKENILAIPMEKKNENRKIFDTIHYSNGISFFDSATALGTVFMVFGVIYGFILKWGPIIWGLIGFFTGFTLGFFLDVIFGNKKRNNKNIKNKSTEVILIINCYEEQVKIVESTLLNHYALGLGKY